MTFGISGSGVKNKAYLIILSAFAIGIITGGLLMNLLATGSSAIKRTPTPMDDMANTLGLTADQRTQIEKLFQESRQHSKEIIKTVQPQLDELRMKTREKVQTVLTPEQIPKYQKWNQNRDAQKEKAEKQ